MLDASCPHYSRYHHQHISSLCKYNKARGRPRVTHAVRGCLYESLILTDTKAMLRTQGSQGFVSVKRKKKKKTTTTVISLAQM